MTNTIITVGEEAQARPKDLAGSPPEVTDASVAGAADGASEQLHPTLLGRIHGWLT